MSVDTTTACTRPSIPPIAWGAAGLWAGIALAEAIAWRGFGTAPMGFRQVLPVVLACVIAALLTRSRGGVSLLLAGLAVGMVLGSLFWGRYHRDVGTAVQQGRVDWTVDAVADARDGMYGSRSDVVVRSPQPGTRVRCLWPEDSFVPELGGTARFSGTLVPPERDEKGRRSHRAGSLGSVNAVAVADCGWSNNLRGRIGPYRKAVGERFSTASGTGGALLSGLVLGDRRRLQDTQAEEDFRIAGLTHLVAISGGHLVVVAGVVTWMLQRLQVRRGLAICVVLGTLAVYVVATGVQPSALRAWLMAAVAAGAVTGGRRADRLAALAAAVVVALSHHPPVAFEIGFMLSVAAVAGLVLFSRLVESWTVSATPTALRGLAGPVALTLTAQAATIPISAAVFGTVSLIAPVSNVLVAPLISVVLLAGLGTVALLPLAPNVAVLPMTAGAAVGDLAGWIGGRIASVPGAAMAFGAATSAGVLCVAAAVWLWCRWPQPRLRGERWIGIAATVLCAAVLVGPPAPRGSEIVVLDVGQGDMILVRDGGRSLVVDTGPDARAAREAIARIGLRRTRAVVLTHLHEDHTGGLPGFSGVVAASAMVGPAGMPADGVKQFRGAGETTTVKAGDRFEIGAISVEVIWPREEVADAATNEASVVMLVRRGSFSALLTGDAESDVLREIIADGRLGDIDVLKVGHHGSADEGLAQVLNVIRPEVAVISVGEGNRHGHPVPATVETLQAAGARVLRTDHSSDITVAFDERGYRVSTGRSVAEVGYGTLFDTSEYVTRGNDEPQSNGPQTGLSHIRQRGAPLGASARAPQAFSRGGGRPRLQHGHVRRGECGRRRCDRGGQYVALRLRAPPRHSQERRQDEQGRT